MANYEEIKELEKFEGELVVANLNDGDKYQLLVRYLNDLATYGKNLVILMAQQVQISKYICEHLGIDFVKKEKETATKLKAELDKGLQESKDKLSGKK